MRILAVTHLSVLYGANKSLLNLIQGTKDTVEWILICRGPRDGVTIIDELKKIDVKCYHLPFRLDVHSPRRSVLRSLPFFLCEFLYNICISLYISYLAMKHKVDAVHSNSSAIFIGAVVSYITSKPHVWHIREFLFDDYRLKFNLGVAFFRFWANRAYKVIVISRAIREKCIYDRGVDSCCALIYNGVVHEGEIASEQPQSRSNQWKLLIMGVLDQTKNQLDAIKAVHLLLDKGYDISLEVVGGKSGDYYLELERYTKVHNLGSNVVFLGYTASPLDKYQQADITLVCSKFEGMGRVTIESMASGTPVVGYDGGGTSELINNGLNGILYTGGEVELAHAVEQLIIDRDLYYTIRSEGLKTVRENYTIENYSRQFLAEIENVKH